jgi:hypothetical protein
MGKRLFINMKVESLFELPQWLRVFRLLVIAKEVSMRTALVGLAALVASAIATPAALAMPNGLPNPQQLSKANSNIEQVRWICNPWGRCWWRPNFYGAYAYLPPPRRFFFHRPWWHHRWRHWW